MNKLYIYTCINDCLVTQFSAFLIHKAYSFHLRTAHKRSHTHYTFIFIFLLFFIGLSFTEYFLVSTFIFLLLILMLLCCCSSFHYKSLPFYFHYIRHLQQFLLPVQDICTHIFIYETRLFFHSIELKY